MPSRNASLKNYATKWRKSSSLLWPVIPMITWLGIDPYQFDANDLLQLWVVISSHFSNVRLKLQEHRTILQPIQERMKYFHKNLFVYGFWQLKASCEFQLSLHSSLFM